MSQPKKGRRRTDLGPADLADLEERESRVVWEPIVHFDRPAPDVDEPGLPIDHGDQPYEPGPSLMDRERRGALSVDHNYAWSGGIVVHAGDGTNTVDVMIDRRQALALLEGLKRWEAGILFDWLLDAKVAAPACENCDGTGIAHLP